jgi:cytochrome P450
MALSVLSVEAVPAPRDGVDPELARHVGDVSRPQRLPPRPDLRHLPGEPSLLRGLVAFADWQKRGAAHLRDQVQRFGPVYKWPLPHYTMVVVADLEAAARIGRNTDGAWSAALGWMTYLNGIDDTSDLTPGATDFEAHKDVRRLLQPGFSPAALGGYLDLARPLIESAVDGWVARGRVPFRREVRALLAKVSSRIFLNDDRRGPVLDRALDAAWSTPNAIFRNRWLSPTWRRGQDGYSTLRDTLRAMVPERRASGGKDLFSRLCAEPNDVAWLDDEGLVRMFIGVMFGAFDTTSAALSSMAYLLARHPEWQDRVREEALALGPGSLTPALAQRLEVTDRCWRETLRFFPVSGGVPRCALRTIEVARQRLPAGTFVLATSGSSGRDADWWTDPERFDPNRFAEGRAEDKKRPGLFLPFGVGVHACIGSMLATLEAKAFWHVMATRCRFRLARDYEGLHSFATPIGQVSGEVELQIERL